MAVFFVVAGLNHFLSPGTYLAIMPPYLPWHLALVNISGVAEIAGGIGVLLPQTRVMAGWGLLALLAAVFPANIQAALHGMGSVPPWILWGRLPFQLVMFWWVWWTCVRRTKSCLADK